MQIWKSGVEENVCFLNLECFTGVQDSPIVNSITTFFCQENY